MAGAWTGYPPRDAAALSGAEATARGNVNVPIAGGRVMQSKGRLQGVPEDYETGTGTYGRGAGPPLGDNAAFASGVSAGVQAEPHPPRGRIEGGGARLTISPSMKVPQESPVPTQGGGRTVPSTPSRQGSFAQGQAGAYGG
jgi:hypothetical protein